MKPGPGQDIVDRFLHFLESHNGQRIAIAAFSILATLVLMAFPGTALAYILGLPLIFFVPGFTLVRLFFWKATSAETKFVLSLGLSVIVVIFLGLLLAATPIGLMSSTAQASLIIFSLGAVLTEMMWLKTDRGSAGADAMAKEPRVEEAPSRVDGVVVAMIATALVISAISVGVIITAKYPSRTYFAMTDGNNSANINVTRLVGTNITLILHMKNGEDGTRVFILTFQNWNSTALGSWTVSKTLAKGETWNDTATIHLPIKGIFRLDFQLYMQEAGKTPREYGELHLWITVS